MTTATRPLAPHGTYGRANGSPRYRKPCKCDPCIAERRRADKRRRVRQELGQSALTDPAAAQAHLRCLHQHMRWETLAAATGIVQSNLVAIYNGERQKIFKETHRKIMAVAVPKTPDPTRRVDALGSRRRIHALQAAGHSYATIAAEVGVVRARIHLIASGQKQGLSYDLADRITRAYRHLTAQPAADNRFTKRTRNAARAAGKAGPEYWDDDDFDNPDFQPAIDDVCPLNRDQLAEYRRDEIRLFASASHSPDEIADLVGLNVTTVRQILANLRTGKKRDRRKKQEAAA